MSRNRSVHPGLAVIIPSRNRPQDLRRCLMSLAAQTVVPCTVLVGDASDDDSSAAVVQECAALVPDQRLEYLRCPTIGITWQRNYCLERLSQRIAFVGFSDDDVEFREDYFERLVDLLEKDGMVAGVGGVGDGPNRATSGSLGDLVRRVFFLRAMSNRGQLLVSGVNVSPAVQGPPARVDWLFGCAVYRSQVTRRLRFAPQLRGYGAYEDVDFSLRAKAFGRLLSEPSAVLTHHESHVGRQDLKTRFAVDVANRHWLVLRHRGPKVRPVAYWWSVLGLLLLSAGTFAARRSREDRDVLSGVLSGAAWALRSDRPMGTS